MEYISLLLFGFMVGLQHALEADHLAAVASLNSGSNTRRALLLRGGIWGLGHTITLVTICGVLLMLGESISGQTASLLEFIVGGMIVFLGVNLLRKLIRKRMHFHVHQHETGKPHIHAHSHAGDRQIHTQSQHDHAHPSSGSARVLLVGMMHGAAGSAGLLVLSAAANTVTQATAYVIAFAAGSILGMASMSFVASYPLRFMDRYASWLNTVAFTCIGFTAIFIGSSLMGSNWAAL